MKTEASLVGTIFEILDFDFPNIKFKINKEVQFWTDLKIGARQYSKAKTGVIRSVFNEIIFFLYIKNCSG